MSTENNIRIVDFTEGGRFRETAPIWQHSYGQILQIGGVELPDTFEVHFANIGKKEDAIPIFGADGQAEIHNQLLKTGLPITAWAFLHSGENDGETVLEISIPVRKRPPPGDAEPEPHQQTIIDQLILQMETSVEKAGEKATEAAILARATATDDGDGNIIIQYPSTGEETGG